MLGMELAADVLYPLTSDEGLPLVSTRKGCEGAGLEASVAGPTRGDGAGAPPINTGSMGVDAGWAC